MRRKEKNQAFFSALIPQPLSPFHFLSSVHLTRVFRFGIGESKKVYDDAGEQEEAKKKT